MAADSTEPDEGRLIYVDDLMKVFHAIPLKELRSAIDGFDSPELRQIAEAVLRVRMERS